MGNINVVAKRTFRFTHPDYLTADKRAETIGLVEGRSVREMREVLGGSRAPSDAVMPGQLLVKANPVEIQSIPEWVTKDPLFGLAVSDGSIRLLRSRADEDAVENPDVVKFKVPPSGLRAPSDDPRKVPPSGLPNAPDGNDASNVVKPSFDSMTKADLVDYAKKAYGVDLDPNQKKDDLVAAIQAQAKKG